MSSYAFSSVQSFSRVWLFATPWIAARQASLSITNSLQFTQTYIHRVCDAIQPSHPLSSPSPPAPNPSQHQSLFQWVNSAHKMAKAVINIKHSFGPITGISVETLHAFSLLIICICLFEYMDYYHLSSLPFPPSLSLLSPCIILYKFVGVWLYNSVFG